MSICGLEKTVENRTMSRINETVDNLHPIVRDFLQTTDIEELIRIKRAMSLRSSATLGDICFVLDDILSVDEDGITVRVLDEDTNALLDMLYKNGLKETSRLTITLGRNHIIIYHFDKILKECGFSDEEIKSAFI